MPKAGGKNKGAGGGTINPFLKDSFKIKDYRGRVQAYASINAINGRINDVNEKLSEVREVIRRPSFHRPNADADMTRREYSKREKAMVGELNRLEDLLKKAS